MTERQRDPWGDMPWSDGEAAAATGPTASPDRATSTPADPSALGEQGTPSPGGSTGAGPAAPNQPATCPWCATPAAEGATRCSSCGAALAQRETIGDLVVPGLTAVDPALKDLDGRPLHLRGPSPTHGVASGIIVAAAAGGPVGLALLGGVGAVAAAEYMGAGGAKGNGHERVGETSEAVLQALERLERGETLPTADDTTPRPELDAADATLGAQSADPGGEARISPENHQQEATDGGS